MNLDLGDTRAIIAAASVRGVLRNQLAYILATAYHETAHTMKPVRETLATSDKQAIARLDSAFAKGQLKWVKTPYWRDGWFGRGYVQVTHKANYDKFGIGKNEALQADTATRVLLDGMMNGMFTGKRLSDYVTLSKSDFVNARRAVNGTDRAKDIAGYAREYDADLKAIGYGESVVDVVPDAKKKPAPKMRIFTWITSGGGAAVLPFVHWSTQLFISGAIVALAVYAIITIPAVREKIKSVFS